MSSTGDTISTAAVHCRSQSGGRAPRRSSLFAVPRSRPQEEAGAEEPGRGQREVPRTDELVARVSQHMAGRALDALLFTEADGRPLGYGNWLKRVRNPQ